MATPGPSQPEPIVHLVEDDPSSREATARFLRVSGFTVRTYASAEAMLDAPETSEPGCILLDLQLPGSSGLELQEALAAREDPLPIVFLTGYGEIADSVRAMKSGAVDFLSKTVEGEALLEAVRTALARDAADRATRARLRVLRARYRRLTPREREVFAHLLSGRLNKQMGYDLGISERTIKVHRHHVLEKMEAASIADLVRMADDLAVTPAGRGR